MKLLLYTFSLFFLLGCKHNSPGNSARLIQINSDSFFRKLTDYEILGYKAALNRMYDSLLVRHAFNGGIIVAKNGEILLEEYRGYANFLNKDTITETTAFHLASISKTFTGMAVLKLAEEKKLSLLDSVQQYFPDFPYHGVTIKLLLTHRSGLPNYPYFLAKDTAFKKRMATNQDMLNYLIKNKPVGYGNPDRGFHYCNTNYALLALIIEKVTGQYFPDYMKSTVFAPLDMNNTYVFSIKDTATYKPSYQYNNRPIAIEPLDCIYGDKNVYSTPRDMLKWDAAMYTHKFITQASYEEATTPYSLERPSKHNYGMGWRLMMLPDQKIVYHNGWWHGNNTCFARFVKDTATVIIIGNRYNRGNYAGMKFSTVFTAISDTSKLVE